MNPQALVLLSGGMDSTSLLYMMVREGYEVTALSADYGQRHSCELQFARKSCQKLGVNHVYANMEGVDHLLQGSALTGMEPVPEGHYTAANMARTVVPNRNAVFLALAYSLAITLKASKVCTAVHAGDHAIYPDCRPEFIKAFEEMERKAITREIYGIPCPDLYAPFVLISKAEIAKIGQEAGVDWKNTWSCYNGDAGAGHCGRCGTCVERIEAFKLAGIEDPTSYQDIQFAENVLSRR